MSSLLPPEFADLWQGPARRYFVCTVLNAIGTGMILSFSVLYVHEVRHQSTFFAEMLLTMMAVAAFSLSPLFGTLTDRIGPSKIMVAGGLISGVGFSLYAFATTKTDFLIAIAVNVVGMAGGWGPGTVMITRLTAPEKRQRAYGFNFMLLNLGIGLGLIVNAIVANVKDPDVFTNLYLANAALGVVGAGIIWTLRSYGGPVPPDERAHHKSKEGWREVLADGRLRHYIIASFILLLSGYMALDAGFALFVTQVAHISVHFVGVAMIFNTLTIVVGQHLSLRRIQGKSRTRVMGLVGVTWAASWLLIGLITIVPVYAAVPCMCIALAVFAVGETRWMPVSSAIVNEIAPEHLRGRYNAASGAVWSMTSAVAPLITAVIVTSSIARLWPVLVAGGALLGGFYATTLRHSLSAREDGLVGEEGLSITEVADALSATNAPLFDS